MLLVDFMSQLESFLNVSPSFNKRNVGRGLDWTKEIIFYFINTFQLNILYEPNLELPYSPCLPTNLTLPEVLYNVYMLICYDLLCCVRIFSSSPSTQLCLILFPEAISLREEVPGPTLVHVPHQGLLPGVVILVLLYEILQEEQVVRQVMLLLHVSLKPVRDLVEVVLADAADEAVVAQVVLHALHHVAQRAERVDDET